MNRGLVHVTATTSEGRTVAVGWSSRSALHKTVKEYERRNAYHFVFFVVTRGVVNPDVIGVGKRAGRSGWSSVVLP